LIYGQGAINRARVIEFLMIVSNPRIANIQLILASNDKTQVRTLTRDLQASKYLYDFLHLDDTTSLVADIESRIAQGSKAPIVLVINFQFAGAQCETLLRIAQDAQKVRAIECAVTNVPEGGSVRGRILKLGARLVEGNSSEMPMELTLH
jgi:hypothetical protein